MQVQKDSCNVLSSPAPSSAAMMRVSIGVSPCKIASGGRVEACRVQVHALRVSFPAQVVEGTFGVCMLYSVW